MDQRALRWVGHVARMDDTRLPKQLLFAWVRGSKRQRGGQQIQYGHRVFQLLMSLALAQDDPIIRLEFAKDNTGAEDYHPAEMPEINRPRWNTFRNWMSIAAERVTWRLCCKQHLRHQYEREDEFK